MTRNVTVTYHQLPGNAGNISYYAFTLVSAFVSAPSLAFACMSCCTKQVLFKVFDVMSKAVSGKQSCYSVPRQVRFE